MLFCACKQKHRLAALLEQGGLNESTVGGGGVDRICKIPPSESPSLLSYWLEKKNDL